MAKNDPDLLYNRAELKIKAEAEARKIYVFKKASGSRSIHVPHDNEPKPKRSKTSSDDRKDQISSISIQLDLIKKQIMSKQQLCANATTVKDFALCSKVQGEMRQLFKEKTSQEKMLKMLQTKERKSSWYQKKRKTSSLSPAENTSSPSSTSMDIRTMFNRQQALRTSHTSDLFEIDIDDDTKSQPINTDMRSRNTGNDAEEVSNFTGGKSPVHLSNS